MKKWQSGKVAKWQNAEHRSKSPKNAKIEELGIFLIMKKMHFLHFLQICKNVFEWSTKVRIKKTHNLTRDNLHFAHT